MVLRYSVDDPSGGMVGALVFVIGMVAVSASLIRVRQLLKLKKNGRLAEGKVLEIIITSGVKAGRYFSAPVIGFTTEDGRQISFKTSGESGSSVVRKQGDTVQIIYDPSAPEKAMIAAFADFWSVPILFGGIGTVFAIIGYVMMPHSLSGLWEAFSGVLRGR